MPDADTAIPDHLSAIPELDLTNELGGQTLDAEWFDLALLAETIFRDDAGLDEGTSRFSLLIEWSDWEIVYPRLESVGNSLFGLGSACEFRSSEGAGYRPFYQHFLENVTAEPLGFHPDSESLGFLTVNPEHHALLIRVQIPRWKYPS